MDFAFFFNPWVIFGSLISPVSWIAIAAIWSHTEKIQNNVSRVLLTVFGAILLYIITLSIIMHFTSPDYVPTPYKDPYGGVYDL